MFVDFFYQLRGARIPVTIREFLMFLEALEKGVAQGSIDEFYYLSRATLVKDERLFDTFDLVFENFFKGAMNKTSGVLEEYIPEEWLRGMARELFDEAEIEVVGVVVVVPGGIKFATKAHRLRPPPLMTFEEGSASACANVLFAARGAVLYCSTAQPYQKRKVHTYQMFQSPPYHRC